MIIHKHFADWQAARRQKGIKSDKETSGNLQLIIRIMVCYLCIAKGGTVSSLPLHQTIGGESLASPSFKPSRKPTSSPVVATRYPTAFPTPAFTPPAGAPTFEPTNPKITEISCHQALEGLNLSIASSLSFQTAFSSTISYVTSVDPHGVDIAPVGAYNFICILGPYNVPVEVSR